MLLLTFCFILASTNALPHNLLPEIPGLELINKLLTISANNVTSNLELVKKYGYNGELHKVITFDGYVLELHRITGKANSSDLHIQKPVAFVMHGLLCNSAVWVLPGPEKGLAFILADAGYDVWLGNARGTTYSRKHTDLSVLDKEYWDFSWHEIGTRDLPATIDYILKTTRREKLFYLGHSEGTTSFFVMASERFEYQDKIEAMFAMAPAAYCGRAKSPVLRFLATFSNSIDIFMKLLGKYEIQPIHEGYKIFQELVCEENAITEPLCSNFLFLIAGFDSDQYNKTLLPIILEYVPAGAATKQLLHYTQLAHSGQVVSAGQFRQFDYGLIGNLKKYGSVSPPAYDLKKIQVPVSLHYSSNDWLANVKDVDKLYKELGNPYGKFRVPHDKFNHLDFMWAIDVKDLLYDKILSLMTHFPH
ncbi:lipase 3-like isoform X2 [Pseudomyrmex gracilis]|uniref:lipase 3-like isoform X2 n=1 Tax=Pseudomyrmex gracilis TaxID=219809 RepID=UPI000995D8D6|nr:lipase 3-like isoform X2 [Pseudomyrmex gracilis]